LDYTLLAADLTKTMGGAPGRSRRHRRRFHDRATSTITRSIDTAAPIFTSGAATGTVANMTLGAAICNLCISGRDKPGRAPYSLGKTGASLDIAPVTGVVALKHP
jgi:hypothetical protein